MIVNAKQMKRLRQSKNWTQQHLAEVCDLSIRTIQRVEKDGVASHETVAAYASIFSVEIDQLVMELDQFGHNQNDDGSPRLSAFLGSALFALGMAAGVGLTLWLF